MPTQNIPKNTLPTCVSPGLLTRFELTFYGMKSIPSIVESSTLTLFLKFFSQRPANNDNAIKDFCRTDNDRFHGMDLVQKGLVLYCYL